MSNVFINGITQQWLDMAPRRKMKYVGVLTIVSFLMYNMIWSLGGKSCTVIIYLYIYLLVWLLYILLHD